MDNSKLAEEKLKALALNTSIAQDVVTETLNQIEKWGVQNHPYIAPSYEQHTPDMICQEYSIPTETEAKLMIEYAESVGELSWADILIEEVVEAISAKDPESRRAEMIQVAAVALSIVNYLDRQ